MRRKRSIVLDEYVPPPPKPKPLAIGGMPPGVQWEHRNRSETEDGGVKQIAETHIQRRGRRRITRTRYIRLGPGIAVTSEVKRVVEDARVDFEEILDRTHVVPDEQDNTPPWEDCDGYEHALLDESQWIEEVEQRLYARCDHDHERFEALHKRLFPAGMRAAFRGLFACEFHYSDEGYRLVVPAYDFKHVYEYARERGASRGVAQEMMHCERRRTIRRLQQWFLHGWHWYGVKCEMHGEHESVWRIDDETYAEKYVRREIAEQMVMALTSKGWLVTNLPNDREQNRGFAKARYQRNLTSQNWDDAIE